MELSLKCAPLGGHNMHGKVERKIQHVKVAMSKELEKERLSVVQWETLGDQIANCVNDKPLAIIYVPKDVEQMDLLTPNRLMLGRNNQRSHARWYPWYTIQSNRIALFAISLISLAKSAHNLIGYCMAFELEFI